MKTKILIKKAIGALLFSLALFPALSNAGPWRSSVYVAHTNEDESITGGWNFDNI